MSVARLKTLGSVVVTTAGTPVKVFQNASFPNGIPKITSVLIRGLTANTGLIYVGDANVDAGADIGDRLTANSSRGYSGDNQNAGGTMLFDVDNLYIDASVSGEGADIAYIEVTY